MGTGRIKCSDTATEGSAGMTKLLCLLGFHDYYIIEDYLMSVQGNNFNMKECGRCYKLELD